MKLLVALSLLISLQVNAQDFLSERNPKKLINWNFKKGVFNQARLVDYSEKNWEQIQVPHTYSMDAIQQTGYYKGEAWYRKKVEISSAYSNKRTYVRFEGVGQNAELFVNGKSVGKHSGAYAAFCFEITKFIKLGQNIFSLKVSNIPSYKTIPITDALFNNYGGIYRPVTLFTTSKTNISPTNYASSGIFIETKEITAESAKIKISTRYSNKSKHGERKLAYQIMDSAGNVVFKDKKSVLLEQGRSKLDSFEFEIKDPILWNAKIRPYQYTFKLSITSNDGTDAVSQKFGIRKFRVDLEKGFFLNDQPYKLNGVCRHQEWENEGPALTDKHHKKDMSIINEMGATALRLAHYQQADIMYTIADKTGLVVWAEIPFVHDWSGREGKNAKQQLKELILQNYNHPSICFWGLWNEVRDWDNTENAACTTLTKELNKIVDDLDPNRISTSASDRDMKAPMVGITDVQAWNKYFGWYYGKYEDMGPWLDKTHKEFPEVKIGISEYGIGANVNHQDQTKLEKPNGNFFPEQEQTKYHEITWPQLNKRDFVWSTFIWNMFDFSVNGWNHGGTQNLNHKGLVSFDRTIKKDAFYFYKANWSKEPVVYITQGRNTERAKQNTNVKVYSNQESVELYLNGKLLFTETPNADSKIALFENVTLKEGNNQIDAIGINGDKKTTHHVEWSYFGK